MIHHARETSYVDNLAELDPPCGLRGVLHKLLRPSGIRDRKYEGAPAARLVELDGGMRYHRASWS